MCGNYSHHGGPTINMRFLWLLCMLYILSYFLYPHRLLFKSQSTLVQFEQDTYTVYANINWCMDIEFATFTLLNIGAWV